MAATVPSVLCVCLWPWGGNGHGMGQTHRSGPFNRGRPTSCCNPWRVDRPAIARWRLATGQCQRQGKRQGKHRE